MCQILKSVVKPRLQLTLALIKPDVCKDPNRLNTIRQTIKDNDFYFIRSVMKRMTESEAKLFYDEHKNKFFYWRLVTFMSSGLISAHILAKNEAITQWRQLMGSTKVYKTKFEEPNTIRGLYGLSDTRNATHGSDSVESFEREVKFFFSEFDPQKWLSEEEEQFRNCYNIEFVSNQWLHRIKF